MRYTLSSLFLLLSLTLPAQDTMDYSPLADRLAKYARLTMDWEVDSLLDLTDPQLFEIVPREAVRSQMAGLSSDEDLQVEFGEFTIDEIGEIVTHQTDAYSPIKCHQKIVSTLLSEKYKTPEFRQRMLRMLQKSHGTGSVRYNETTQSFSVVAEKSLFAIRRGKAAAWNFVEYRPENAALLDLLLPPAVRVIVGLER
ncbi:MAG: hypothetical protein AB8H12_19820 [Lewinella sp.]